MAKLTNSHAGAYSYAETEESSSPTKYSYRFEQRVCAVSMGNFEDLAITRDFRDGFISGVYLI